MTTSKYTGTPPYGYELINKILSPIENETNIRKEIYEIFIDNKRLKTTAEKINQKGFRTRLNSKFTDTTILRLLTDPIVLGIENETPAIISQETFDTVQKILSTQESTARLPVHLFSGIVYCGNCDTKMRVFSSISKKYTCPDCRRKIDKNDLEKIYLSQLKEYSLSSSQLNQKPSLLNSINKRWKGLDDESKIQLIKSATDRITVLGKEVEITFYSLSSKEKKNVDCPSLKQPYKNYLEKLNPPRVCRLVMARYTKYSVNARSLRKIKLKKTKYSTSLFLLFCEHKAIGTS